MHYLSSDTNSPSDGDSKSECPFDCEKQLNSIIHHLIGSAESTKERGFEKDSKSNGEAGSEFGALGVESSHEPTTPKFIVQSKVVRETPTTVSVEPISNVGSDDVASKTPSLTQRSLSLDVDYEAVASETVSGFKKSLSDCEGTLQSMSIGNSAPQHSIESISVSSDTSIMTLLLALKNTLGGKSDLCNANLTSFKHVVVESLPAEFNGNCIFELPALYVVRVGGSCKWMAWIEDSNYRHVWTETATSNISDPSGKLSFKYVKCMEHLRCNNPECRRLKECKDYNDLYWSDSSTEVMTSNTCTLPMRRCNLVCKFCKVTPSCLALCPCKMYYVFLKDHQMSRTCIHFGTHEHPVARDNCCAVMEQTWDTVMAQIAKTPTAKASAIEIVVGKEFLMKGLIEEDSNGKALSEDELNLIFEKWSSLSSSTLNNLIHDARVSLGGGGYIDNILKLKKGSMYDYIQDSCFLGQDSELAYVFKMSTIGPGSGVDLVRRMEPSGDLVLQFVMFDHVKQINGWTTLGIHIYDPIHCKVKTICLCDMKSKSTEQ